MHQNNFSIVVKDNYTLEIKMGFGPINNINMKIIHLNTINNKCLQDGFNGYNDGFNICQEYILI